MTTSNQSSPLPSAQLREIAEKVLTQLPKICDDNYDSMAQCRKVILRAMQEWGEIQHTAGWDAAIKSCGEQLKVFAAALDEIATTGADTLDGYEAANIATAALARFNDGTSK